MRLRRAAAALLALLLAVPAPARAAVVVARVNGVAIEQRALDRAAAAHTTAQGRNVGAIQSPATYRRLVREALDRLVDEELLAQEAVRRGHRPSAEEVARAAAEVRAGLQGPAAFEIMLEREGLSEAGFTAQVARRLAVARLVAAELSAGPAAVEARLAALRKAAAVEILLPLGGAP